MSAPIVVVNYDPAWRETFMALRTRIAPALGDLAAAIEHVGSTAVPGLAAKPIIDIDVLLASADGLPQAVAKLAALGYTHEGDLGVPGREAFRPAPDQPIHHLYVCMPDCAEYRRHIAFRDHLRAHPADAKTYGDLKFILAQRYRNDRDGYGAAKTAMVQDILQRATDGPS